MVGGEKRVLITGAGGFIASHIVEHLLFRTDWEIIGLDSFRHRGDPLRIHEDLDPDRFRVYCVDLAAPLGRLERHIGQIDYIINAASDSHVDRSIDDPVPFVQNNVNLMLTMLEYARRVKPLSFLHISTDEVYGPAPEDVNHPEWSPIIPSNPYSASKAAQEAIAISYWRTYGVPLVLVNCMNAFGERQDPEKFIPLCIDRIAREETVPIHAQAENPGSRFYLHARNIADALLHLIMSNAGVWTYNPMFGVREDRPERYNVVGELEMDNLSLARLIAEIVEKPLNFEFVDFHSTRPGHDPRYALDGTRMAHLGWKPPVSFHDSLRKTVEWTLAHEEWLVPV